MDNNEGQDIYLKQFIQRQENLLLDFLRKNIDLEIRNTTLTASLKEMTSKYEESQKQVALQNDLMQQAATGVESLTVEKKVFEQKESEYQNTVENLKTSLHECKKEREEITRKYNEIISSISGTDKKYNDLMEEYRRQTEELNVLFKENQDLKSKTLINKRKPKQAILPPDEF